MPQQNAALAGQHGKEKLKDQDVVSKGAGDWMQSRGVKREGESNIDAAANRYDRSEVNLRREHHRWYFGCT